MIKKLLLSLLVLAPILAIAEDAPICPAPKADQGPWVNTFNFGYNKTSGNSDVSLLNLGFLSKYEKDEHLARLQADHNFGETEAVDTGEKQTNVDYSFIAAEYKNIVSERLYLGLGVHD
jgi:putative salt-induced outer membrane protein YdiY